MADFQDFATLFSGSIRAQLDWNALAELNVPVTEQVTSGWAALGALRTVWHVDAQGRPADWCDPGATALTVREAAGLRELWPVARQERVAAFRARIEASTEPFVLLLPTYRVGRELLLLDSSHRVMAGYLARAEVRALIMTLVAPLSPELLPDLGSLVVRGHGSG
ncbi:hypothetical protein F5X71_12405 [Nocardia brasiliensis]|uniref:Uncharacterized protein n=1 Tax=Nocardia brasiliensis TaxID=37326 RepID=A0A6G9XQ13_NOCBR|nr:hypothetical protein [Nocardia brasiliensis]QIS03007.1 hypothetical protein F5X71_12405 [Nocardia brasiliensis]